MKRVSALLACALIGIVVGADDRAWAETLAGAKRTLTPEAIGKAIELYLEKEWASVIKDVQVTVLDPAEPITLPASTADWRVVPVRPEERMGRRHFQVVVTVNGKAWKTVDVAADVVAMVDAIALNRFVKPDEIIEEADLKTVRVRVFQLNHAYLVDAGQVIGRSAARPLPMDTPIRAAFLKAPLVIKKGEGVLIEARRGGLAVHAYGVTKSSGQVGQTITVANSDSGKELRAKVVAPGLVQVEF